MKNTKGFAVLPIIIVIALLAIVSGLYVHLQKSKSSPAINKTASQKTYTNAAYGFSLQYPADWTADEKNKVQNLSIVTFTSDSNNAAKITFLVFRGSVPEKEKLACPVDAFHLSECKELISANGAHVVREIHQGISSAQTYIDQYVRGYFQSRGYILEATVPIKDFNGKEIPGGVQALDSVINSLSIVPAASK